MLIDISEPGLWNTIKGYHQSVQLWNKETDVVYQRAADKERARYEYLKQSVLANDGN